MRRLVAATAATATFLGCLSWAPPGVAGEVRRIEGLQFDEVLVLGDISVEIVQGDVAELQIQGDEVYDDADAFRTAGNALVLGSKKNRKARMINDLKFRVIVPELKKLKMQGSGDVYVKPWLLERGRRNDTAAVILEGSGDIKLYSIDAGGLELRLKGSGDIKAASLDVDELEVYAAGSGDVYVQKLVADRASIIVTGSGDMAITEASRARELDLNVVGSGSASLKTLECNEAEVNIVGSGSISLGHVNDYLEALILGSGSVRYSGEPELDTTKLGSGEVRRRK